MGKLFCEIEQHTWASSRGLIKGIRPDFADIIDNISPGNDHRLYLIKYPYGALALDRGVFQLPNSEGAFVPISHASISSKIKENLSYSDTIPLGLVTTNGFESFAQSASRILPSTYMEKGKFLSLWRVLEEEPTYYTGPFWSYSAGACSICMTPKITDSAGYKGLKTKYGLKLPIPQRLSEHWNLFRHIANHPNFTQPWTAEIIFFSKHWFEHKKDKHWDSFYRFLLNEVWHQSSYRRNQFIFDSAFSIALENRNLKPNPYLADTVKHLVALGSGSFPAFAPAIDNSAAPISGLQQVFLEDYGLKKYAPVIMHLYHFSQTINRIAYYSFQLPTTTSFSPKSRKSPSIMVEMQELENIVEVLMSEILKGKLGIEQTPLYNIAQNTKYSYYHSDLDKSGTIMPASKIAKIDPNFTKTLINNNNYVFPDFSPFFKGCIALSASSI